MLKNISRILPFFIITLLSIGGVELLYGIVEQYLLLPKNDKTENLAVTSSTRAAVSKIEKHDNYQVILDRNLFESYIKAPEPAEPVKENVLQGLENTSLDLVLMGTVTGPDGTGRAIIMAKAKKEQDIYYEGEDVGGATIKEIMRGKVILTYLGKDEILDMSEASNLRPKDSGVGPTEDRMEVVQPPQMPRRRPIPANVRAQQEPQEEPVVEDIGSDQDSGPAEIEQDVVNEPEPIDQEDAPELIEEVVPPDREDIPVPGDGEGPPVRTDKDGREIIDN